MTRTRAEESSPSPVDSDGRHDPIVDRHNNSHVAEAAREPEPVMKDCCVCWETRQVGDVAGIGFKVIKGSCEHIQDTCNVCIGTMIELEISERNLDEPVLACGIHDCEYVLKYQDIMQLISKADQDR